MVAPALLVRAGALGYPHAPPALAELSLEVRPGERVAVLGGNGTGKTALLKTAVGLLPVVHGEVRIFGRPVEGSPAQAARAGAGLVFQNPDDQLFGASVLEDVLFGPRNQGLAEHEAVARAQAALESVGIAALADRPIERLSFGEKKRACLAGVLAMRPSLLLLDEPTAGLDPLGELALVELLNGLAQHAGATLVVATHAVDLVPLFAERVVLLGEGRVLADGPPSQVFARPAELERARVRAPWGPRSNLSSRSHGGAHDTARKHL